MTDAPIPSAPEQSPEGGPPRGAARVIAILTMALGAVIVVGTVISSAASTAAAASVTNDSRTAEVDGVDRLDLDLEAGSLRVEFADITDAELEVTSAFGAERWTFERDDYTLRVGSPDSLVGALWLFGGRGTAVLTLPESLEGVDAGLQTSAGDLIVVGDFGNVDLEVGAGRTSIEGSASALVVDLSAGDADVDLEGVRTADLTVSAGTMDAALSGSQPDSVTVAVSAGELTLDVPDGEYEVESDVTAGDLDDRLGSTPGAGSTVSVDVSAGSVTLRSSGRR